MDFFERLKLYQKEIDEDTDVYGQNFLPNKYVDNDPKKPKEEVYEYPLSEKAREIMRTYEIESLRKRYSNFSEGVDISENMQRIDIELMDTASNYWNYMPLPNKTEMIELITSIENVGLINPIVLLQEESGLYTILCGRSRYLALCFLYANNPLDKYKYPMCFVLDSKKVDEHFIRALMIDSNFNYRKIPQRTFIKMILERFSILKRSKQFRNDLNIAERLSEEFSMSTSSVYNYLSLSKLSEEIMTLLLEGRISLQVGRAFARVEPDIQVMILNNIDFKDINFYFKMEFITRDNNMDTLEKVQKRIRSSNNIVPQSSGFYVKLNNGMLKYFTEKLVEILKEAINKFSVSIGNGSIGKFFKIKFDKSVMKYLASKNYVDEKILSKLSSRTIADVYGRQ